MLHLSGSHWKLHIYTFNVLMLNRSRVMLKVSISKTMKWLTNCIHHLAGVRYGMYIGLKLKTIYSIMNFEVTKFVHAHFFIFWEYILSFLNLCLEIKGYGIMSHLKPKSINYLFCVFVRWPEILLELFKQRRKTSANMCIVWNFIQLLQFANFWLNIGILGLSLCIS